MSKLGWLKELFQTALSHSADDEPEGIAASEDSMSRFLAKLRDLIRERVKDGDLSAEEFDECVRVARSHAGGMARAEKRRQPSEDMPGEPDQHMADATDKPENEAADAKGFPYSKVEQLPDAVKKVLPPDAQRVWMAAFNSANKAHPDDEARSIRIAWSAVMRAGWRSGDKGDKWVKAVEGDVDRIVASLQASSLRDFPAFAEVQLVEGNGTGEVQIFPAVGSYSHPRYGEIRITKAFLNRVKKHFDAKIYQQELPLTIDLEHQSSLSGAAGWITSLDIRGDDGMWASIEFNARGKELVQADAYRYFSPEFYDKWQDPATNKEYQDLLIGGALTNRPFFKGMAAVVAKAASEMGGTVASDAGADAATKNPAQSQESQNGGASMGMTEEEARQFRETQASVQALTERLNAADQARQAAEAKAQAATERIAAMERADNRRQLSEFVDANRGAFVGKGPAEAVDWLEKVQGQLGADDFKALLDDKAATHRLLAESAVFSQMSGRGVVATGAEGEWDAAVAKVMSERNVDKPAATGIVAGEQPQLYARYQRHASGRAVRAAMAGGD